jgi:hypothetical protein
MSEVQFLFIFLKVIFLCIVISFHFFVFIIHWTFYLLWSFRPHLFPPPPVCYLLCFFVCLFLYFFFYFVMIFSLIITFLYLVLYIGRGWGCEAQTVVFSCPLLNTQYLCDHRWESSFPASNGSQLCILNAV